MELDDDVPALLIAVLSEAETKLFNVRVAARAAGEPRNAGRVSRGVSHARGRHRYLLRMY